MAPKGWDSSNLQAAPAASAASAVSVVPVQARFSMMDSQHLFLLQATQLTEKNTRAMDSQSDVCVLLALRSKRIILLVHVSCKHLGSCEICLRVFPAPLTVEGQFGALRLGIAGHFWQCMPLTAGVCKHVVQNAVKFNDIPSSPKSYTSSSRKAEFTRHAGCPTCCDSCHIGRAGAGKFLQRQSASGACCFLESQTEPSR